MLPCPSQAQATFLITPTFLLLHQHLGLGSTWSVAASTAYQIWAVKGFFNTSWWRAALAYLAALLTWFLGVMISAGLVALAWLWLSRSTS